MARIGKRAGKASMMRIGKKSVEMLPDDPNLSLATFVRDERGGNMGRSWKTNFGRRWPNFISRFVRFSRTERGGSQIGGRIARRWSKGRSAFMRLGKRKKGKLEMIKWQKRDPEIILKRDFGFGGRGRCVEEEFCNVEFNRNGVTYRIFYRHN